MGGIFIYVRDCYAAMSAVGPYSDWVNVEIIRVGSVAKTIFWGISFDHFAYGGLKYPVSSELQ